VCVSARARECVCVCVCVVWQYSGSHALKGDLTRTGRRTVGGLLQVSLSSSSSSSSRYLAG
jgi:hypothetical protein